MENTLAIASIIAIIFALLSVIETRFIRKDGTPFKSHVKNTVLVFISAMAGMYVMQSIGETNTIASQPVGAFTGAPGF
jgi:ABC-type amino acid transport system permease subunit